MAQRTPKIEVLVSPEQKAAVEAALRKSGHKTVSDFARHALEEAVRAQRVAWPDNSPVNGDITRIPSRANARSKRDG